MKLVTMQIMFVAGLLFTGISIGSAMNFQSFRTIPFKSTAFDGSFRSSKHPDFSYDFAPGQTTQDFLDSLIAQSRPEDNQKTKDILKESVEFLSDPSRRAFGIRNMLSWNKDLEKEIQRYVDAEFDRIHGSSQRAQLQSQAFSAAAQSSSTQVAPKVVRQTAVGSADATVLERQLALEQQVDEAFKRRWENVRNALAPLYLEEGNPANPGFEDVALFLKGKRGEVRDKAHSYGSGADSILLETYQDPLKLEWLSWKLKDLIQMVAQLKNQRAGDGASASSGAVRSAHVAAGITQAQRRAIEQLVCPICMKTVSELGGIDQMMITQSCQQLICLQDFNRINREAQNMYEVYHDPILREAYEASSNFTGWPSQQEQDRQSAQCPYCRAYPFAVEQLTENKALEFID